MIVPGTARDVPDSGGVTASGPLGSSQGSVGFVPNRPRLRPGQQMDPDRRATLAASFSQSATLEGAWEYDAVRPRYPEEIIARLLDCRGQAPCDGPAFCRSDPRHIPGLAGNTRRAHPSADEPLRVVELGAGTGILTRTLLAAGADVDAVEPSRPMTQVMAECWNAEERTLAVSSADPGRLSIHRTTAERTGLPEGHADLVVAAQAWHWFDEEAVTAEVRRLLRPGGVMGVVGNFLDTSADWVHRLTRIMRAGDIYLPDWRPRADDSAFQPWNTLEQRWVRKITPEGIRRLARTLSSWLSTGEAARDRMAGNLDWYLGEHLQLKAGEPVSLPYITQLHLTRRR